MLASGSPPSSRRWPAAGGMRPASVRTSVVLPAPFGPISRRLWPAATAKESSAMTARPPRSTDSLSTISFIRASPARTPILEPVYIGPGFASRPGRIRAFNSARPVHRRCPRMSSPSLDSFKCRKTLKVGSKSYQYFSLPDAEQNGLNGLSRLPFSLKVLLENLLRHEDGRSVRAEDIRAVLDWLQRKSSNVEIAYRPARVLMQ